MWTGSGRCGRLMRSHSGAGHVLDLLRHLRSFRPNSSITNTARNEAMDRMIGECMGRGGNAILGLRMDIVTDAVWCQICAYGTACLIEQFEE